MDSSGAKTKSSSGSAPKKKKEPSKKEAAAQSKALAKEQKRKKQEQKAMKKEKKKSSKQKKTGSTGGGDDDEDDMDDEEFEKMVAEILARDTEHNLVTVEKLTGDPDHPRASFSMCLAGNNPQDGFVIFGGEYFDGATSKCFDDVLRFRLLPSGHEWKRITSPNSPPPRCAHATCTTPTHVYVFGGEFSTAWRFHHYNDLWRLDLKTNQWHIMPSVNGPSARSGSRMVCWKNFLVVFGGFYEASRGVRWHDDLHFYDLRTEKWAKAKFISSSQQPSARSGFQFIPHPTKPIIFLYGGYAKVAASASAQKGRAMDDMWILHLTPPANQKSQSGAFPECKWEFLPKKGAAPSRRSGASSCAHKNKMLLFGGVSDTETQNDVVGEFYNSLFAFDMDRLRWFELGLKTASAGGGRKGRRGNKKSESASMGVSTMMTDDVEDEVDEDEEEDNNGDDEEGESAAKAFGLRDDAFYVIVDGKFVLVEADDEESPEAPTEVARSKDKASSNEDKEQQEATMNEVSQRLDTMSVASSAAPASVAGQTEGSESQAPPASALVPWNGQPAPAPRISAGMCVMNNRLFIVGGTAEVGDAQITYDDMWTIDLNKMDSWQELSTGRWREQQWAGAKGEEEEGEDDDDEDDEEGESGSEDEDEGGEEGEEEEEDELENNVRALREEIKTLRDELGVDQEQNTPSPGESMKDFFARTVKYWLDECIRTRNLQDERLSGKELRGMAFEMARRRFELLSPLLDKLNSLQEAQRLAEEEAAEEAKALAAKMARRNAKKALKKAAAAVAEEDEDDD